MVIASEGQLLNGDTRNTKVVIALIFAMTAGARILLWLEPGGTEPDGLVPLLAVGGAPVEDVLIEYAPPEQLVRPTADVVVLPDGQCTWDVQSPHVRLLVVGSDEETLSRPQKEALLRVLASMSWGRGASGRVPVPIALAADCDPAQRPDVRKQAYELAAWLASKGFIQ